MRALLLILLALLLTCTGCERSSPERSARQFADGHGVPIEQVTCEAQDADGDGYVSCLITVVHAWRGRFWHVECPLPMSGASVCKETEQQTAVEL